jgi:hypothetical protein
MTVGRTGDTVSAVVTLPRDDARFAGHFPGDPTLAASAQLATVVLPAVAARWPELDAPGEVRRLKLHAAIRPGDELVLLLARDGDVVRFEIRRGEIACTTGELRR